MLGGGQQGRVIAADLAASRPADRITVADLRLPQLPALPNLTAIEADLSSAEAIARLLHAHDMGVGALPSRFGYGAMQAAIAAKRPLADVSFSAESPLTLHRGALAAGVTIVPDCGLAPGLSHLAAGTRARRDRSRSSTSRSAASRRIPRGPTATWSRGRSRDLLEGPCAMRA